MYVLPNSSSQSASPPSITPWSNVTRPTIMVVDDVPENLRLLSMTLSEAGYDVRSAISGALAMMAIAADPPDLILLDVTMPEMDGFEVCQQLKAKAETAEIPIIFISALGEALDKVKAFQVGGADYVTKPFQIAEVLARVCHQLELCQLKNQLRDHNQELQISLEQKDAAEAKARRLNQELEQRVLQRTQQLNDTNQVLEREVQERRQAQAELMYMATCDSLTGLANRTFLLERLGQTIKTLRPNQPVILVILDCDRFEIIQDTLGHRPADQLLMAIASRITSALPSNSLVARINGDEFAILHSNNNLSIECLMQTLQQTLSLPFELGEYEIMTNPSIGIAQLTPQYETAEHLFRDAYQAMVRAKQQAPGSWCTFKPEMGQQALRRLSLEGKLRQAIQKNQLQVYYQPIVVLGSQNQASPIVGFEALARWQPSPNEAFISPGEFIPLAEETGLILPLGNYVLETACQQIQAWNQGRTSAQALFMSVNLSVHQLSSSQVDQDLEAIIQKTQIQPSWLKLEITESVLMQNPKDALETLVRLRKKGVQVSIDDFGTGYSSLSYLKDLPIDILKIDRAFIKDLASDQDDIRILEAILGLSQVLDLEVVAEGIETDYQAERLMKLGSTYGQGYRFSKPLDSEAASAFLSSC